jgi:hypothetical protein
MRVALLLVLALGMRGTDAEDVPPYKIANATDIGPSVVPIDSTIALNNLACMHLCSVKSNCVVAVLKTANNNCSLYTWNAQTGTIYSAGSILYQKRINGHINIICFVSSSIAF